MPSEHSPGGSPTSDAGQKFKRLIGEDPLRYLDQDLLTSQAARDRVRARIRGMDKIETVRVWRAAELNLDDRELDELEEDEELGREKIISWLESRERYLQDMGELPDDLEATPDEELPQRYQPHERDLPEREWFWTDPLTGERLPLDERPTTRYVTQTDDSSLFGGESEPVAMADGGQAGDQA